MSQTPQLSNGDASESGELTDKTLSDLDFVAMSCLPPHFVEDVSETALQNLVRCHHDLMRASDIGSKLPTNDVNYQALLNQVTAFILASCDDLDEHTRLQALCKLRHIYFKMDATDREIWLSSLWLALDASNFPRKMQEKFWYWMESFSIQLLSTQPFQVKLMRYPFNWFLIRTKHPALSMCRR